MRLGPWIRNRLFAAYSHAIDTEPVRELVTRRLVDRDELTGSTAANCIWFEKDETVEVSAPEAIEPLPDEIRKLVGSHQIGQPFVCEVPNIELLGPDALAITPDNRFVFEQSLGSIGQFIRSYLGTLAHGHRPTYSSKSSSSDINTAVALVGPWCRGYYHWISEYLLRLKGLERYINETGIEPKLIIPQHPPEWMITSLDLLGFSHLEYSEWSGTRTTIESLIVPSLRRETDLTKPEAGFIFSPRAYRWLGDRIRSAVDDHVADAQIFISRENADERHVLNQDDVLDAIEDRGFEKYVLEDLSFAEQVRLFSDAETIVGPLGAGLVNMVFAKNTNVITMYGRDVNACYPVMADTLGFGNAIMTCESVALDMRADPEKLLRLLDHL